MSGLSYAPPVGVSGASYSPESRGFIWFVLIVIIFVLGVLLANAIYFKKLVDQGGTEAISKSNATWLFWLNLILAVAAAAIFIWALVRLLVNPSVISRAEAYLAAPPTGVVAYDPATGQYVTNFTPGNSVFTSSSAPELQLNCDATGKCVSIPTGAAPAPAVVTSAPVVTRQTVVTQVPVVQPVRRQVTFAPEPVRTTQVVVQPPVAAAVAPVVAPAVVATQIPPPIPQTFGLPGTITSGGAAVLKPVTAAIPQVQLPTNLPAIVGALPASV